MDVRVESLRGRGGWRRWQERTQRAEVVKEEDKGKKVITRDGEQKEGSRGKAGMDFQMTVDGLGEEEKGDDTKSGIKCSKCAKKGHVAATCTNPVYCVICNGDDHVNHKCLLLKQSRPVAHAVGYAVHGLGFYHIPHPPLSRSKKESKKALIRVGGGKLTKEKVVSQLQRLYPGKWNWELEDNEDNTFITTFPSKSELQRAIAFGGADVREDGVQTGVRLQI